jgi:hypothetical protein
MARRHLVMPTRDASGPPGGSAAIAAKPSLQGASERGPGHRPAPARIDRMPLAAFASPRLGAAALGLLLCGTACAGESPRVVSEDVGRFWAAYDRVRQEPDPARKRQLLQAGYLDRASPGLGSFVEKKGCTADTYVDAFSRYPRFWASVRANTLAATFPRSRPSCGSCARSIPKCARPAPTS